jgi:hypothetical protein
MLERREFAPAESLLLIVLEADRAQFGIEDPESESSLGTLTSGIPPENSDTILEYADLSMTLEKLGEAAIGLHRMDDARAYYTRALAIRGRLLPADHPLVESLARTLDRLVRQTEEDPTSDPR